MKKKFYQNEVIKFNSMLYGDLLHIKTLTRTKRYLDNHFHVDINLHVLALSQGFSKYHLLRLFKFYFGITPRQYQISKRIEEAKNKLKNGCRVAESCYDVGFQSTTTFSTLFKRKTGMTPMEFKKSNF